MKKIIFPVLILICVNSFAQAPYKYQVRVNFFPIDNFYYAGAARIGFETVNRKWNIGVDYLGYSTAENTTFKYYKDTMFRRGVEKSTVFVNGFGINLMRNIQFKSNSNKLIFGLQGFVGKGVQTNISGTQTLDTMHYNYYGHPNNYYDWHGNGQPEKVERHSAKLMLGICPFVRFQFTVYKRFTFTPELILPVVLSHFQYGPTDGPLNMDADVNIGFNFCVGYRFGKID